MCGYCDPDELEQAEPDPDMWHDELKDKEVFGDV